MSFNRLASTNAPAAVILIRLMVGLVFLSEGIQKFLFADALGPGRFVKIGLPAPEFLAYFVAVFEIGCGTLIILGLLTRLALIVRVELPLSKKRMPSWRRMEWADLQSPAENHIRRPLRFRLQ